MGKDITDVARDALTPTPRVLGVWGGFVDVAH